MLPHWHTIILVYVGIFLWATIPNLKEMSLKFMLGAVFFPLVVPAWLIAAGFEHYFLTEFRLRRKMRAANRLLPRSSTPQSGTIILDSAACDHHRTRVWWTPDDIPAITTEPIKDDSDGWQGDKDILHLAAF